MKTWIKSLSLLVVATSASMVTFAQSSKNSDAKSSKEQDIIIRKKGDKGGKTTIVVDGDNITINGTPIDQYKGDDLTVLKRDGNTTFYSPRLRAATTPGGFKMLENNGGIFRNNKAMLGVVTEKTDGGARVTEVNKESGAEKAGLKKDDIITRVGDTKIEDANDLVEAIGKYKPNDKVEVTYKRGNKENKTSVTLSENKAKPFSLNLDSDNFNFNMPRVPNSPSMPGEFFSFNRKPKIGLQIQDLEEGKGAKVKDVDDDSPAAKAGFKEGDVITEVNGKQVASVDELRSEIKDLKEGDTVRMKFKRGNNTQTAEIKLPKRLKTADL